MIQNLSRALSICVRFVNYVWDTTNNIENEIKAAIEQQIRRAPGLFYELLSNFWAMLILPFTDIFIVLKYVIIIWWPRFRRNVGIKNYIIPETNHETKRRQPGQ